MGNVSKGHGISICRHYSGFSPEEIVRRARCRIGESSYQLISNNSAPFCSWCVTGAHKNEQAERKISIPQKLFRQFVRGIVNLLFILTGARLKEEIRTDPRCRWRWFQFQGPFAQSTTPTPADFLGDLINNVVPGAGTALDQANTAAGLPFRLMQAGPGQQDPSSRVRRSRETMREVEAPATPESGQRRIGETSAGGAGISPA